MTYERCQLSLLGVSWLASLINGFHGAQRGKELRLRLTIIPETCERAWWWISSVCARIGSHSCRAYVTVPKHWPLNLNFHETEGDDFWVTLRQCKRLRHASAFRNYLQYSFRGCFNLQNIDWWSMTNSFECQTSPWYLRLFSVCSRHEHKIKQTRKPWEFLLDCDVHMKARYMIQKVKGRYAN